MFQQPLTLILLQKYRDTNGSRIVIQIGAVYTTFCKEKGILLQKYRDRNGRYIAILFKSIGVRGRFDSPDLGTCLAANFRGATSSFNVGQWAMDPKLATINICLCLTRFAQGRASELTPPPRHDHQTNSIRILSGKRPSLGILPAPYRSLPGPLGPESPKSLRQSLGRPRLQKVSETVSEESPESQNSLFETPETLPRLFRTLFGPGAGRPRETLSETLWESRARRARETSLSGRRDPNPSQGRTNPAFSKPCLCQNDTRHFRRFRRGSEEQSPCFQ